MYTDSHIHLYDLYNISGKSPVLPPNLSVCASAHETKEFLWQEDLKQKYPDQVYLSFGIHPQDPDTREREFLYHLVQERRIQAIGECGYDLFSSLFKKTEKEQKEMWALQLDLALTSGLPLIIHARKAMHLIFSDFRILSKVRAVVFHGWSGSLVEAESLLKRGIPAYFSAGKGLLRNDTSLCNTVAGLPLSRLLTETDSPYMTLKGEGYSQIQDIYAVTRALATMRKETEETILETVHQNFNSIFAIASGSVQVP